MSEYGKGGNKKCVMAKRLLDMAQLKFCVF
jgi:hypothetical protein